MSRADICFRYYKWMQNLVDGEFFCAERYSELLSHLYGIDYIYTYPMDGNRAEDGISLRYRFGQEKRIKAAEIADALDCKPCSMLEMMVALALRCEEDIMFDPKCGNRTGLWFKTMICSLGLGEMTNGAFNFSDVDHIIFNFLEHRYEPNGDGSLFKINEDVQSSKNDMRRMELWNQMGLFLTSGIYI